MKKTTPRIKDSCLIQLKGGPTFNGTHGNKTVNGEQQTIFTFDQCVGSGNGTGIVRGQIPEIYYYPQ